MTGILKPRDMLTYPAPPCVWRVGPRGLPAREMFFGLISEVGQSLLCIQCFWRRKPGAHDIELALFFQRRGFDAAVFLGGITVNGGRRILGGSYPPFLEVAAVGAIGEKVARFFLQNLLSLTWAPGSQI